MENKKVKNAHERVYNNIKFKSDLEVETYILLCKAGFNPEYEKRTFHLWKGKNFLTPCYDLHKDRKLKKNVWGLNRYKPVDIKYKPDFTFFIQDASKAERMVVVEAKGYPNDRYAYVKKLFRSWLEENSPGSAFFEVHNLKQAKAAIEIINNLKNETDETL